MFGYADQISVGLGKENPNPATFRSEVRCRKCPECLRHRARLWTARAIDETTMATRTWFGTLTLSPDRQTWARYSALQRMQTRVSDNTPENVFRDSVKVLSKELTLFLKRLRKVQRFRYLLVTEAHKSGLPHYHILIHEYVGAITKRDLEDKWRFGFSHWRLITDAKACGYCCKYLAKSALTRVRASEDYGQPVHGLITERIERATRQFREAVAGTQRACHDGKGSPAR